MKRSFALWCLVATVALGQGPDMTDLDNDGLPDVWEAHFGLSTNRATGIDGPFGDPDNDGLSNYAEYMAGYWVITNSEGVVNTYNPSGNGIPGLSPVNPMSVVPGVLDAYLRPSGSTECLRFTYTDGDFCDDFWELTNKVGSVDLYDDCRETERGNLWNVCREAVWDGETSLAVKVSYGGNIGLGYSGNMQLWFYNTPTMSGAPLHKEVVEVDGNWQTPKTVVVTNKAALESLTGKIWVTGFIDMNNNGVWNTGEPLGCIGDGVFVKNVGFGHNKIGLQITDRPMHGIRLELPAGDDGEEHTYTQIQVNRTLVNGSANNRLINDFTVLKGRWWIQDSDWLGNGLIGFDYGLTGVIDLTGKTNFVYKIKQIYAPEPFITITNILPSARPRPVCIYPSNGAVVNSRKISFVIGEGGGRTREQQPPCGFYVHFYKGSGVPYVYYQNVCELDQLSENTYSFTPDYVFGNNSYTWETMVLYDKYHTIGTIPNWSATSTFTVADRLMSPDTAGSVDVGLFYAGKTLSGDFQVAAFETPSFSDFVPVSLTSVSYSADMTNMAKGVDVRLNLLPPGKYYLAAWKGANTNEIPSLHTPWGYHNHLGTPGKVAFNPKPVTVPVSGMPPRIPIIVEDIPGAGRR